MHSTTGIVKHLTTPLAPFLRRKPRSLWPFSTSKVRRQTRKRKPRETITGLVERFPDWNHTMSITAALLFVACMILWGLLRHFTRWHW